jgi:hypothetical protein
LGLALSFAFCCNCSDQSFPNHAKTGFVAESGFSDFPGCWQSLILFSLTISCIASATLPLWCICVFAEQSEFGRTPLGTDTPLFGVCAFGAIAFSV